MKRPLGINYRTEENAHYDTDLENTEKPIQHKIDDAVPQHFSLRRHKLADVEFIPLELINSNRASVRRAQ